MTPPARTGTDRAGDEVLVVLPEDLGAPNLARQVVRETLTRWQLPDLVEDAELATSELVTNACKHALPPVVLKLSRGDGQVRIDVSDMRPATVSLVLPAMSKDTDESGRGCGIIAAVSDHSGTDHPTGEGESTSSYAAWDVDPRP
jgi:anti-sigma regulatory factor (Ser/Thr protein kinase)